MSNDQTKKKGLTKKRRARSFLGKLRQRHGYSDFKLLARAKALNQSKLSGVPNFQFGSKLPKS